MKNINLKQYATIDQLIKTLTEIQNQMKKDIKNGANITYKNFATLKQTDKHREDWSKEDKALADKYLESLGKHKIITAQWTELKISNIDTEINDKITEIFDLLELSQDKTITKVASAVANAKK